MAKAKQISVSLENRPGSLAHVGRVLGGAKVNILALQAGTSGAEGYVNLIADNPEKAKKALAAAGVSCTESDVLVVELPHRAGALGEFAGKLAAKQININSAYATSAKGGKKAIVVFAVSDLAQAARMR